MNPIVTRKQIVLSILVGIATAACTLEHNRRTYPQLPVDSANVAMAVIFGMAFALSAFLGLRPQPKSESEAEKRSRILGAKIDCVIIHLSFLGVAGIAFWTYLSPGHFPQPHNGLQSADGFLSLSGVRTGVGLPMLNGQFLIMPSRGLPLCGDRPN